MTQDGPWLEGVLSTVQPQETHVHIHLHTDNAFLVDRLNHMEATLMTALDDARQRLTDKIDAVLTIARELRARIDATEDTTADTAALNADADRLDAAIAELQTENQTPAEEPPVGGQVTSSGGENPSLGG